jgi:hypothetical protein
MHFTRLVLCSNFLELKKLLCKLFCTWVKVTQGTDWRGPSHLNRQATLASSARASTAMAGCREPWRRRSGAGERRGRGPLGPWAHQGVAGEVAGARGGRTAAESAAASSGSCRRNGNGGGDSGLPGAIPLTETKEAMRRS